MIARRRYQEMVATRAFTNIPVDTNRAGTHTHRVLFMVIETFTKGADAVGGRFATKGRKRQIG